MKSKKTSDKSPGASARWTLTPPARTSDSPLNLGFVEAGEDAIRIGV